MVVVVVVGFHLDYGVGSTIVPSGHIRVAAACTTTQAKWVVGTVSEGIRAQLCVRHVRVKPRRGFRVTVYRATPSPALPSLNTNKNQPAQPRRKSAGAGKKGGRVKKKKKKKLPFPLSLSLSLSLPPGQRRVSGHHAIVPAELGAPKWAGDASKGAYTRRRRALDPSLPGRRGRSGCSFRVGGRWGWATALGGGGGLVLTLTLLVMDNDDVDMDGRMEGCL